MIRVDDFSGRGEPFAAHCNVTKEIRMNVKRIGPILLAAIMVSASGLAASAENSQPAASASSMPGMGQMQMDHGMANSGGAMDGTGMMGMMHSCQQMMGGAMQGRTMLPRLPPGNEKLEFQMRAEMMQKIGEIAARYGQQIKEAK